MPVKCLCRLETARSPVTINLKNGTSRTIIAPLVAERESNLLHLGSLNNEETIQYNTIRDPVDNVDNSTLTHSKRLQHHNFIMVFERKE